MYMNCNYIRYIERRLKPQVISQFKFVFRQEEIHTGGREAMETREDMLHGCEPKNCRFSRSSLSQFNRKRSRQIFPLLIKSAHDATKRKQDEEQK